MEALPTEVTDEWPLAAVDPLVILEVGSVAEGFGALVTFKGFLSSVNELVGF